MHTEHKRLLNSICELLNIDSEFLASGHHQHLEECKCQKRVLNEYLGMIIHSMIRMLAHSSYIVLHIQHVTQCSR